MVTIPHNNYVVKKPWNFIFIKKKETNVDCFKRKKRALKNIEKIFKKMNGFEIVLKI